MVNNSKQAQTGRETLSSRSGAIWNRPAAARQFYAATEWLLSQPPLDMTRMVNVDFPSFERDTEVNFRKVAYNAIMQPIENVLIYKQQRGEVHHEHLGLIAGALVASIQAIHTQLVQRAAKHNDDVQKDHPVKSVLRTQRNMTGNVHL